MARRQLTAISRVVGIIDDPHSLPSKGAAGDSWYEESAGLLWIWDDERSQWVDIGRLHRASPALAASLGEAFGFAPGSKAEKYVGVQELTPGSFVTPSLTEAEADLAREACQQLTNSDLGSGTSVEIQLHARDEAAATIAVPIVAMRLFLRLLAEMAEGRVLKIVPSRVEFTAQEAADALNVSKPFLLELIEADEIPGRKIENDVHVRCDDLLAYKHKDDEKRAKILDELTADARELELGY